MKPKKKYCKKHDRNYFPPHGCKQCVCSQNMKKVWADKWKPKKIGKVDYEMKALTFNGKIVRIEIQEVKKKRKRTGK